MRSPASRQSERRRHGAGLFVALVAGVAAVGCSLFVDTSGLDDGTNGGDATTVDGPGGDGASDASDSATEAAPPSDAGDADGPIVSLDGCVLLLHMNEATWAGSGSVIDSSGQENSGSAVNGAVTTADGKFGRAGLFSGTTWVDVPASPSLDAPMTQLTLSAWIYPTALTDGGPAPGIISKRESFGMNVAYTLFLNENNLAFFDLQGDRSNSNSAFANDAWYHVVVVYDGSLSDAGIGAAIYINGALDRVHPAGPVIDANNQDVLIANLPMGGQIFTGKIDEVAIWTRALSADEIKKLYLADHEL